MSPSAAAQPGSTPPAGAPRLPVGTQVVLLDAITALDGSLAQKGSTGRVLDPSTGAGEVRTAGDGYRVRLSDDRELEVTRAQVALRRAVQQAGIGATPAIGDRELVECHTIYAAIVGSRAFGLSTDESDTDVRGVYVAPTRTLWRLAKPSTHVDGPQPESFSWEVERFCELALRCNPNMLEVLHSTLPVVCTDLGSELVGLRSAFISQLACQTYNGYTLSQFAKIEADLRRDGVPKWKHVMHLLRLLLAVDTLLRTGEPMVDVGPHRDRLLAVRHGEVAWDEVEAWRHRLHAQVDDALAVTVLPAHPDVAGVDDWLVSVRERCLG